MHRDPRAVRQIAEEWDVPEQMLWDQPQTFAEAALALRLAFDDLRAEILAAFKRAYPFDHTL